MASSRFHGWFVAFAAALVLLVRLGEPALWDDDEPKNAACSLAMLEAGDWVVPTFNGRLRIEKPPLVNWLQIAGFSVFGRNEIGARIASALLTVGTCLLTWRIGRHLAGPMPGLLAGLAMATCVWTAVGGRAATPDAPLLFFTTLALLLFVRGTFPDPIDAGSSPGDATIRLPSATAAAVGAACGAALLAKGPVGLVLPLASFVLFSVWLARSRRDPPSWASLAFTRPVTIVVAALLVAAPWYAWVTLRTDGAWLRGFLLVHNVQRFATPMEGHAGSFLYYPAVVACGFFPWSIVLAAVLWHTATVIRSSDDGRRRAALALVACWLTAWIGGFSCSGTKLPGYVWPAYPALAIATGIFLDDWQRGCLRAPLWSGMPGLQPDRVMRVAWTILAASGLALAVALPLAASEIAGGGWWLGLFGGIPLLTAAAAWRCQSARRRGGSLVALGAGACLLVACLASVGAEWINQAQGARNLVAQLGSRAARSRWAYLWNVPPSLVFYAGGSMEKLDTAAEVAAYLTIHPEALVVIDSRQFPLVAESLPPDHGVLANMTTLSPHEYLLLGPLPIRDGDGPLASND